MTADSELQNYTNNDMSLTSVPLLVEKKIMPHIGGEIEHVSHMAQSISVK
jgi:hypothetical protein